MAVKTVKTVKPVTAERKNGRPVMHRKPPQKKPDYEALMSKIETDPDAPLMAKEMVALARERDKSGEPYLTIEQIWAELGRGG